MSALICGSLAYDTIMVFPDQFKNHILPGQGAHPERVVPGAADAPRVRRLRRQHRLQPASCSAATRSRWRPSARTSARTASISREHGIRLDQVKVIDELFTPQAFITTDLDNNQITAFHPGAMMRSYENHVRDVTASRSASSRPDGRDGDAAARERIRRSRHSLHLRSGPGDAAVQRRGVPRTSSSRPTTSPSTTTNPTCCSERTGWGEDEIAAKVKAYIITRGPKGSLIHTPTARRYDDPARARAPRHRPDRLRRRVSAPA